MALEPNKPGMRDKVHSGSKIRTPFLYPIADAKGGKAPKSGRSKSMSNHR